MLDPYMESTKPTSMYVEPGQNLSTVIGHGGKCQLIEVGAKRARWGCGRTMAKPERTHLRWVASCEHCDLAHGGFARG